MHHTPGGDMIVVHRKLAVSESFQVSHAEVIPSHRVPTVLPTLKPRLDSESDQVNPQVGSSVTLRCEARGFPEPEITWYKNGLQLAAGNGLKMDRHQLEITGVQVSELSNPYIID